MLGILGGSLGFLATLSSVTKLDTVVVWSALLAATLRYATPLTFAAIGGLFSERSGVVNIGLEGMMLMGAFFEIVAADKLNSWQLGLGVAMLAGGLTALIHAVMSILLRRPDRQRHGDQLPRARRHRLLLHRHLRRPGHAGEHPAHPDVTLPFVQDIPFIGDVIGQMNLMIWLRRRADRDVRRRLQDADRPAPARRRRASARGRHRRDQRLRDAVRGRVVSGMLAAAGGAYLSIGFLGSFNENMTAGRGFIALAALIFGNWRPFGAFGAALLFGFSSALAQRLPEYSQSGAVLFQALPYVLTLIAVAGVIGRSIPPAAVGRPYVKQ